MVGRRRLTITTEQRLENLGVALKPGNDGFLPSSRDEGMGGETTGHIPSLDSTMRQMKFHRPVDDSQEAPLGFDALWKRRDIRVEVLRNLSNPWPGPPYNPKRNEKWAKCEFEQLPEAYTAPMPHSAFVKNIKQAQDHKAIRQVLRAQLLRCEWPRDILRVMAVAMQKRSTAQHLAALVEPLVRALYRCRQNVSDAEVLKTINVIVSRFNNATIKFEPQLLHMGAKFAARARSLRGMKKYLRLIRKSGKGMSSHIFRSVIAKFSIGHRGLGEIRNGRWRRDQLMQTLAGFEDTKDLPPEQQYHLGSFLQRDDWQFLHGWIAVLARCRDSERIWREWELWKESDARNYPKKLASQSRGMTTRVRGDYWFADQMAYAGDMQKAWQIFKAIELPLSHLSNFARSKLLESVEYAPGWSQEIRDSMVWKYDRDLRIIEAALGVRWVAQPGGKDEEGRHELVGDQEEALELLGADGWTLEQEHGYPYRDDAPLVPSTAERALHDAKEVGSAEISATGL